MKQHTQIGATVKEAISLALQKLGKTPEQVDVEVLQEGKKGFLGIGARPAEVRVTVKENQIVEEVVHDISETTLSQVVEETEGNSTEFSDVNSNPGEEKASVNEIQHDSQLEAVKVNPVEETVTYIMKIATSMGIKDLKIDQVFEGKYVTLKLHSKNAARLIGKRGQTLNSIQQLAQLVLNKTSKSYMILELDVEDYRERRRVILEQLAERMADKAIYSKSKVEFEPMPSYERKIIHNALANRLDIDTYSEGEEPHRYLVIIPMK